MKDIFLPLAKDALAPKDKFKEFRMSNWAQKVYFLSLQRYFSFGDLINHLSLSKEEAIHITKSYGREYSQDQEKYFNKILGSNLFLNVELLTYIENNRGRGVTLDELSEIFKPGKREIATLLCEMIEKTPKIFPVVRSNELLFESLRKELGEVETSQRGRDIFDKDSSLGLLLEEASKRGVEELSLLFNCSPHRVEEKLVEEGVGCFWLNENIRTNSPFFFSQESGYSKGELLYLLNNINLELEKLAERLNVTASSIEKIVKKVKSKGIHMEMKKNLTGQMGPLDRSSPYIFELLNSKKENNQYIYEYGFEKIFNEKELRDLEYSSRGYLDRIREVERVNELPSSYHLMVDESGESILGKIGRSWEPNKERDVEDMGDSFASKESIAAYRRIKR